MPAPLNITAYPELTEQFIPLAELILFYGEEEVTIPFNTEREAMHWRFRFYAARKAVDHTREKLAKELDESLKNDKHLTAEELQRKLLDMQGMVHLLEPLELSLSGVTITLRPRKIRREFTANQTIQELVTRSKAKRAEADAAFADIDLSDILD